MNILIVGATSAIAQETARLFAARGDELFLVGRNEEKLQTLAGSTEDYEEGVNAFLQKRAAQFKGK